MNGFHAVAIGGRRLAGGLLDTLLPPRCAGCGVGIGAPGALCADCWAALDFITDPACARCGLPFPHDVGGGALCADCIRRPPPFDEARAAVVYGPLCRRLVLDLKRGDRGDAVPPLARLMVGAGGRLLAAADAVVPVPLHWRRLLGRRFNQSALLAHRIGDLAGLPVEPDLLRRTRPTATQGGLSRLGRWRNVRGAFAVRPGMAQRVAGRRLVVIDDVMTTGATVEACAEALKKAGAARVAVLTLARVVQEAASSI